MTDIEVLILIHNFVLPIGESFVGIFQLKVVDALNVASVDKF